MKLTALNNKIKIVAPLNRPDEINALIDSGVDELYCGLLDKNQWQAYASIGCLNRRAEISANLNNLVELKKVIEAAHRRNTPIILTLNEYYNESQSLAALRQAEEAINYGVDALLVADLGLMLMLKDRFKEIKVHLSSCATVFNSEAIRFYLDLGISRIVLHRHLNIEEIKILKNLSREQLDMEVFILNERCYNLDGYCSFQHGNFTSISNYNIRCLSNKIMKKYVRLIPGKILQAFNSYMVKNSHPCCFTFQQNKKYYTDNAREDNMMIFNTPKTFLYACGVCAIYDFYKIGISHIKIAGRSILTDQVRNVSLVKQVINLLDDKMTREEFISEASDIVKSKYRECAPDRCYYSLG